MSPPQTSSERAHRPAQPRAGPRQPPPAQARRPRRRLGHRQDLRPRAEGRGLALGLQAPRALRGRPDADPHADAKAARAAHEEVDAVRAVPHAHPAGQHRPRSRSRFDAGAEVTLELMQANGLATRKDIPVKVLAKGELSKALTVHAHALQRRARASASRPPAAPARRRALSRQPAVQAAARSAHRLESAAPRAGGSGAQSAEQAHALDDPQRLPGRGHPQEDRLHGGDAADLPARLARARAGRQPRPRSTTSRSSSAARTSSGC